MNRISAQIAAFFVSVTLVMSSPAFALRAQAGLESSSETTIASSLRAGAEETVDLLTEFMAIQWLRTRTLVELKLPDEPYAGVNKILLRLEELLGAYEKEWHRYNKVHPSLYHDSQAFLDHLGDLSKSFLVVKQALKEKTLQGQGPIDDLERILLDLKATLEKSVEPSQGTRVRRVSEEEIRGELERELSLASENAFTLAFTNPRFRAVFDSIKNLADQINDPDYLERHIPKIDPFGLPDDSILLAIKIYLTNRVDQLRRSPFSFSVNREVLWELTQGALARLRPLEIQAGNQGNRQAQKNLETAIAELKNALKWIEFRMGPEMILQQYWKVWRLLKLVSLEMKDAEASRILDYVSARIQWPMLAMDLDLIRSSAVELLRTQPENGQAQAYGKKLLERIDLARLYIIDDFQSHFLNSADVFYHQDLKMRLSIHSWELIGADSSEEFLQKIGRDEVQVELFNRLNFLNQLIRAIETTENIPEVFYFLRDTLQKRGIKVDSKALYPLSASGVSREQFSYTTLDGRTIVVDLAYSLPARSDAEFQFSFSGPFILLHQVSLEKIPRREVRFDSGGLTQIGYQYQDQHRERSTLPPNEMGVDAQGRLVAVVPWTTLSGELTETGEPAEFEGLMIPLSPAKAQETPGLERIALRFSATSNLEEARQGIRETVIDRESNSASSGLYYAPIGSDELLLADKHEVFHMDPIQIYYTEKTRDQMEDLVATALRAQQIRGLQRSDVQLTPLSPSVGPNHFDIVVKTQEEILPQEEEWKQNQVAIISLTPQMTLSQVIQKAISQWVDRPVGEILEIRRQDGRLEIFV